MSALDDDNQITVLVVHPDDEGRAGFVTRLGADPEIDMIGVLDAAEVDDVLVLMPDVLVVATGHDDLDAPALIRHTHEHAPVITVVGVLVSEDDGYAALAAGALSCLAADEIEIEGVVKSAWRGESHLSTKQAQAMLIDFDRVTSKFDQSEHKPTLTETEREVLERLAQGEQANAVADEYEVTDRLVNLHAGYAVGKIHWALDAERQLAGLPRTAPPTKRT